MRHRNHLHRSRSAIALAVALSLGLGACASTLRHSEKLSAARVAVHTAETQGALTGPARTDLEAAQSNLQKAEYAMKKWHSKSEVDRFAYIAEQSAQAAIARHESVTLQKTAETPELKRDVTLAQHKAETAETEAERVRQLGAEANSPAK